MYHDTCSMIHFIKAPCHQSNRQQGYQFAPDEIKQSYDHEVDIKSFTGTKISQNDIKICDGYNKLYKYIINHDNELSNDTIITIGGDFSVCASTIPALNEKYKSDLKVLCIGPHTNISTFDDLGNVQGLNEVAIASVLGILEPSLASHILSIKPEQVVYVGTDSNDSNLDKLNDYGITHFTLDKIKQIGIDKICEIIKIDPDMNNIHICIDTTILGKTETNKLSTNDIKTIIDHFKDKIVSMDITEFNPYTNGQVKEYIKEILVHAFDIKEKTINIFTEDSKFLIYRSLAQENPDTDIGWYIMRGLSFNQKKDIMDKLDNDRIITIHIDDEDYLITCTSMNEQNQKSYFTAKTIQDTTLFPSEKQMMCFELVNTT